MKATPALAKRLPIAPLSLCLLLCGCAGAARSDAGHSPEQASYKQDVRRWYEAFDKHDPALLDTILSDAWVDIPAPPGEPAGPAAAKRTLSALTTSFPDFRITIEEILQDGQKVVVRSRITGTQRADFIGLAAKNRPMTIAAVDIHEFEGKKIVRTWHTEDWMTGLRQLGHIGN